MDLAVSSSLRAWSSHGSDDAFLSDVDVDGLALDFGAVAGADGVTCWARFDSSICRRKSLLGSMGVEVVELEPEGVRVDARRVRC